MSKPTYKKAVLTYSQQIEQLERRGLSFSSKEKSEHLLSVISYVMAMGFPLNWEEEPIWKISKG